MATISSGSVTFTINAGEQYRVIATGEAYVDIGGGSTQSYRLINGSSEKVLGGFIVATPVTIRVISGGVEYINVSGTGDSVALSLAQSSRTDINGVVASTADAELVPPIGSVVPIPVGLGWDSENYPVSLSIKRMVGALRMVGASSKSPLDFFNAVTTAFSAPTNTYYVDVAAGNDTTGTGAVGAPYKSIWKAVEVANAAGQPAKVMVKAGIYPRVNNIRYGTGGTPVQPSVDIAFVAYGGRVVVGAFDQFTEATADATYTNTYSVTLANAERCYNLLKTDEFGGYEEFQYLPTAALVNITDNSWTIESGKLYVRRKDKAAVTNLNTRVTRGSTETFSQAVQKNIAFLADTGADGWDIEGGGSTGQMNFAITTPSTTRGVVALDNVRCLYAGGYVTQTTARSISFDSFNGLLVARNCTGIGAMTDAWNIHNTNNSASPPAALLLNCGAYNSGRYGQTSCQSITLHENCILIDVGGYFEESHGGNVRNINTSKMLLAGTYLKNDRGDLISGGGVSPVGVRADDTAEVWMYGATVDQPSGTLSLYASSGGKIHQYGCALPAVNGGAGLIDSYLPS